MTKRLNQGQQDTFACIKFDLTFKVVICNPRNERLMIDIIELLIPDKHIDTIQFLPTEKHGLEIHEKSVTFDCLCKDMRTGEEFLVEVQSSKEDSFADRMLSYSTYPIREQMEARMKELTDTAKEKVDAEEEKRRPMDYTLKPVYMIGLLNFSLDHSMDGALDESGLISRYSVRNDFNGEPLTDALHFVFVEMGRLPYGFEEQAKCRTLLEKFVFSMMYIHRMKERPDNFDEEMMGLLYEASMKAKLDMTELQNYDKAMYTELDRLAQLSYARKEGRTEGSNARSEEIAKKMQSAGVDPAFIKEMTGIEL